jgi:hypothetical protein
MFKYNSVWELVGQLVIVILFWVAFYSLIYLFDGVK